MARNVMYFHRYYDTRFLKKKKKKLYGKFFSRKMRKQTAIRRLYVQTLCTPQIHEPTDLDIDLENYYTAVESMVHYKRRM